MSVKYVCGVAEELSFRVGCVGSCSDWSYRRRFECLQHFWQLRHGGSMARMIFNCVESSVGANAEETVRSRVPPKTRAHGPILQ